MSGFFFAKKKKKKEARKKTRNVNTTRGYSKTQNGCLNRRQNPGFELIFVGIPKVVHVFFDILSANSHTP